MFGGEETVVVSREQRTLCSMVFCENPTVGSYVGRKGGGENRGGIVSGIDLRVAKYV